MIISVNGREKKIAILDNGRVTEFYIERGEENAGIAGNIYKGRVQRVLPGMQSAFVSIGLERDAFLYVSDFFDEEEEIERIVMEKSKKTSPEEAKREADDRIERARLEREKQMESVQDIAEPLVETPEAAKAEADEIETREGGRRDRGRRGKGKQGRSESETRTGRGSAASVDAEQEPAAAQAEPIFEFEDFGFERVVDDDTGDMFKDAYLQEAIVDQVRAIEFDMESSGPAEVGSLLGSVTDVTGVFERIADEEEISAPEEKKKPARSRGAKQTKKESSKKSGSETAAEAEGAETEATGKKPKAKTPAKSKSTKGKSTRGKAKATPEVSEAPEGILEDAEASVKEPSEAAEMSVRRGGRGRGRRRGRRHEDGEATLEFADSDDRAAEGGDDVALASDEAAVEIEDTEKPKETKPAGDRRDSKEAREKHDGRGDRREAKGRSGQGDGGKRFDRNDRRERGPQPTISDLLREGQEILVQIAKEPIAKKGARITSHIALPGRYLVYMPTIEHLGVSRKIESSNERGRLRTLIQRIRQDEQIPSGGFIVRTAGIGISEEDLRQDARYLVRTWQDIKKTSEKAKSPALVHQDLDLVQRLLRDQLSDNFAAIRCDSEEEYLRTIEFINRIQPRMVNRVKLYTREEPILEAYGVQEEIDKALKPRVWLKSGGYLVINQTEALVAIDVNTGKFVGKGNARLEDTITRTNMEAVDEIARQIRLRDLGGIIVLDLIDMEDRRNRHKVLQALQEALSSDKSPTKVLSFNDFGLIIMTRKRVKQSLERTMCSPCEYCDGAGWVKSPQTVCYEILAEARRLSRHQEDVRQTTLRVHPEVVKALRSSERPVLEEIEAYLGSVDLTADPAIHQEQFDFAFI